MGLFHKMESGRKDIWFNQHILNIIRQKYIRTHQCHGSNFYFLAALYCSLLEFTALIAIPHTSSLQEGSKSKTGAIKCCKEIKITAHLNERRKQSPTQYSVIFLSRSRILEHITNDFLFFQLALLYVIVVDRTSLKKSVDFVRLLLFSTLTQCSFVSNTQRKSL